MAAKVLKAVVQWMNDKLLCHCSQLNDDDVLLLMHKCGRQLMVTITTTSGNHKLLSIYYSVDCPIKFTNSFCNFNWHRGSADDNRHWPPSSSSITTRLFVFMSLLFSAFHLYIFVSFSWYDRALLYKRNAPVSQSIVSLLVRTADVHWQCHQIKRGIAALHYLSFIKLKVTYRTSIALNSLLSVCQLNFDHSVI